MRWLFIIAIAMLVGVSFTQIIEIYPDNYVKIYVDKYLVEMSLLGFLLLLCLLAGSIYVLLWAVGSLLRASTFFSRWRRKRGHVKANEALGSGYLALIKGDWKKAEKKLISQSDGSAAPYINYLAAAQAAQEQSQLERRDEYLSLAYKAAPNERFAIGLAKARLHHLAGQHEQAEATLEDIESAGRKNSQFIAMQLQTYQATKNWSKVHDLLPLARKYDALPTDVLQQMDTEAHQALMLISDDRRSTWKELPKEQQKKPVQVALYAQDLIRKGDVSAAEKLLRSALKNDFSEDLVTLYGSLETEKPAKLRRVVEGWLMARPESAALNLAAGRFALKENNSALAQEYLQKSIQLGQLPTAYALLGELLEANNEGGRALQLYRAGIAKLSYMNSVPQIDTSHSMNEAVSEGELISKSD